ncbi:MAG: hypothetical protein IJU86_02165 [Firmicutes bacterium]|nr:hypothetical protein [Bacillota bacterium]
MICVGMDDDEVAMEYVKNFVEEYNSSLEKQKEINDKIYFKISKEPIHSKGYIQYKETEINNLENLCDLKVKLIKDYLYNFGNVNLVPHHESIFYEAQKLKIPVDLLNNIFDKFAEYGNLSNDDFKSEFVWDKDEDEDEEKLVYPNRDFAYLCAIIYQTLYDLYGEDACKDENFKSNMEKLFTDERILGFRKLIAKLIGFENFCNRCNSLDYIGFPYSYKNCGLMPPNYMLNLLESFQKAMKNSGLNLLELAQKCIEDQKSDSKTKDTNLIKKKDIRAEKQRNERVLIWKNLILILLIGLTDLASLIFGINIKFLFLAFITNPSSIIITVVAVVLFVGLTIYANKVKAIRLQKLCCGKESDGKPFFNIYKDIDHETPEQSESNNLIKK